MQIEKLDLRKTKNMRDMGGYPTMDGKKIKCGKLVRCGRLSKLPPETVEALEKMDIRNIIDMRTDREIAEHPPTILKGVAYHYIILPATAQPELTTSRHMSTEMYVQSKRVKRDFGTPENYMREMYKFIAFNPECQKKLKAVLDIIINAEGCTVFHCNSGTDRTGIVAMLLESVLGVDRQLIVEDYMASKIFQRRRRYWQKFGLFFSPIRLRFKRLLYAQMLPKPQYIIDLMDEIEAQYGSVTGYVKNALGVTEEQIKILKDKYLE